MNNHHLSTPLIEKIILAVLFILIGMLACVVLSPYRPLLQREWDYIGRLGLIILLGSATVLAGRNPRYQKYKDILLSFTIFTSAIMLGYIFNIYLILHLKIDGQTPSGIAIEKVNECLISVGAAIVLTRLSGASLGSIYIQKGNLKLGLIIGLVAFALSAAGAIPMASLFNLRDTRLSSMIPWLHWVLIAALVNGTLEEILYRGLFLRKLQPFFGKFISNAMIALVFTGMHKGATYTADEMIFLAVLIPLALLWGYIMQKTDSVIASILFHAGMDIPIFLGIFQNLQ